MTQLFKIIEGEFLGDVFTITLQLVCSQGIVSLLLYIETTKGFNVILY